MTNNTDRHQAKRVDLPLYPKAFIAAAKLRREANRVFAAMPFEAGHSKTLWRLVQSTCEIRDLKPRRADSSQYPRAIVADILEEIESAEIIIADLTGLNPNVLYELGIAHARCESVVLLCKRGQTLPFDLASIRCLFYDLSTTAGKEEFTQKLGRTLDSLRQPAKTTVIENALDRTRGLIADLKLLADLPDEELSGEFIWFSGFLSSFAISEDEPFSTDEKEFHMALLEERDWQLKLARRGCSIRCIITPPTKNLIIPVRVTNVILRLKTLITFLESGDPALRHIDWAISTYGQKNSYIIGHNSYWEGFKATPEPPEQGFSFSLTLRQTEPEAISASIELHRIMFERLRTSTLINYQPQGHYTDDREALRMATIWGLKRSLKFCNSLARPATAS